MVTPFEHSARVGFTPLSVLPVRGDEKDQMTPKETRDETLSRVTRELGAGIRSQANTRWGSIRTAHRNEGRRHVWRFSSASDGVERFLHVPHRVMVSGSNAAETLMAQLGAAKWLDRIQDGPETSFLLSASGRLKPWTPN
jgi:hypothetical protein